MVLVYILLFSTTGTCLLTLIWYSADLCTNLPFLHILYYEGPVKTTLQLFHEELLVLGIMHDLILIDNISSGRNT